MKILVSGEHGFLCQRLMAQLALEGPITSFYLSRSPGVANSFKVVDYDLSDLYGEDQLDDIDVLVHIAGYIPEPENGGSYNECVDANVGYTQQLVDFSIAKKIPKFIFISSFAIFEGILSGDINDDSVPAPLTRYSQSKLSAEHLVLASRNRFANGVSVLRPAFIYGKGMKLYRMIPFFIGELSTGNDLLVHAAERSIELSYVGDVCKAIINSLHAKEQANIVNLVNEVVSKKDVVATLKNKLHSYSEVTYKSDVTNVGVSRNICSLRYLELLGDGSASKFSQTCDEMLL